MTETPTTRELDARYRPFASFSEWRDVPIAAALWDRRRLRLEQSRAELSNAAVEHGNRQSLIAAALNTGAIEGLHRAGRGLTLTVVEHAVDWEPHVRAAAGVDAEAQVSAAMDAFDMALDAGTRVTPISESWIRQVHAVATRAQTHYTAMVPGRDGPVSQRIALEHGTYKRHPNHVLTGAGDVHAYCPVDRVVPEMRRFVEELRTVMFESAHPILQAAYAHHAFVTIHPFQEGNGRVSRVLASVFLLRAASIPLLIYEDQQADYFAVLAQADGGDFAPFVRFIQDQAVDLMAYATDLLALPTDDGPLRIERPVDRVPPIAVEAAERLAEFITSEFAAFGATIQTGEGIECRVGEMGFSIGARDPEGRRTVRATFPYLQIAARAHGLNSQVWMAVYVTDEDLPYPLVVRTQGPVAVDDPAEYRISDVYPRMTAATENRTRAHIRRAIAETVRDFQRQLETS
jgi:Fic family protein